MYKKCISCPKLGVTCDGPNFVAMTAAELVAWCKARKSHLGYSSGQIAETCGMPKGTIDGFFAGTHADFRFETIRPIVRVLIGGNFDDNPCPEPSSGERAAMEEKIRELENGIAWRDDKIQGLQENCASMKTLITNTNKRHTESREFLQDQIRGRNKAVITLGALLGICLLCILAALIVDGVNPNIGYIWTDGGLQDHAIWLFIGVLALACVAVGIILFVYKKRRAHHE